jgi:hypothetical protein
LRIRQLTGCVVLAALVGACISGEEDKNRCESDEHCLEGYRCNGAVCLPVDPARERAYLASVGSFTAPGGYVDVPGGALSFTPATSSEVWLVLLSARISAGSAKVRYLVNGQTRGVGDSTATSGWTPWQHVCPITGSTEEQKVRVQLAAGEIARLQIVAFPLPGGSDFQLTQTETTRTVYASWTDLNELSFAPGAAGTYLVIAGWNSSDLPGKTSIKIRLRDPNGAYWPTGDVIAQHYGGFQSNLLVRSVELPAGPASFALQALGSETGAQLSFARVMAFRTDGLEHAASAQRLPSFSVSTSERIVPATLTASPPGERRHVVLANVVAGSGDTVVRASFLDGEAALDEYSAEIASRASFSYFDLIQTARSFTLKIGLASPAAVELRANDATIHILRL